jgi:hypothetical protein
MALPHMKAIFQKKRRRRVRLLAVAYPAELT